MKLKTDSHVKLLSNQTAAAMTRPTMANQGKPRLANIPPWTAVVGHDQPWPTMAGMAGHGRPWPAMIGYGWKLLALANPTSNSFLGLAVEAKERTACSSLSRPIGYTSGPSGPPAAASYPWGDPDRKPHAGDHNFFLQFLAVLGPEMGPDRPNFKCYFGLDRNFAVATRP